MTTKNTNQPNGYGIASLVLGIAGLTFNSVFPPFALVFAIIGIFFAKKQNKIYPNGIATAGLITSIIGTVIGGLITLFFIFIFLLMILAAFAA